MKRVVISIMAVIACVCVGAQDFDNYFENKTLRLDYVFAGDNRSQSIFFQEAYTTTEWAGRRHNLSKPLLSGNGQICVKDKESGDVIYSNSFSSLFQEWQSTEEATTQKKAFENCFQVPLPKKPVEITISLIDTHGKVSSSLTHALDPKDILIRQLNAKGSNSKYVLHSGNPANCIDIAIMAEGYTKDDMEKFYNDAQRAADALMEHEPFKSHKNKFNIIAVASESEDNGTSIPEEGVWKNTAASAHFSTFYSDRYLMTTNMQDVYDNLAGVPFDIIIVMVNTPIYGGGGIYNSVTVLSSDHPTFKPVLVHEFGHAFAGLGDEYFYDDQYETMYPSDTEPWEPNLTTLVDFNSKWKDMLGKKTAIPTPAIEIKGYDTNNTRTFLELKEKQQSKLISTIGVYEGGGYQSKGVYRPAMECRMKINEAKDFCPVCTRAIIRMIDYYTE